MPRPEINANECIDCGFCLDECEENVFGYEPGEDGLEAIAVIHPENCIGCGVCDEGCPTDAIEIVE